MRANETPPIPEDLISTLNAEQRAAVLHGRGPALILAGAGSGKTRVLIHRIAGLISVGIPAFNILALTFTNKAAREMKERVNRIVQGQNASTQGQVTLQTFHAFGASFLRLHADQVGRTDQFLIYDRDDQLKLIKEVLKQQKVDLEREALLDLCAAFDTAKQLGRNATEAYCPPLDSRPGVDVKRLGCAYEELLKRSDAFDFGDLIVKPLKILTSDHTLRNQYRERFAWVLVDEFQDTNKSQLLLLQALSPPQGDLFVVGDDDQSIYAWRGAEVTNILGFDAHFPDAKTYKLQQNYRSNGNILSAANGVIRFNASRLGKQLWTEQEHGNKITLYAGTNEYDEAHFIASQINNLVLSGRFKYSDIAILYRANALSLTLENTFINPDFLIPYLIVRGRHFFQRAEIKDALAYLRLLINPRDMIAYQRAINTESRGVGKTSLSKVIQLSNELNIHLFEAGQEASRMGIIRNKAQVGIREFHQLYTQGEYLDHDLLAEQAEALLKQAKLYHPEYLTDMVDEHRRAKTENISRLIDMIRDFEERTPNPTWFSFLEQVKLISEDEESEQATADKAKGAVSLMTVHASKGLEFPVVFLIGLEEDLFPNARRGGKAELEEERRLFYVAVTRAEKILTLSYAQRRTVHGRNQPRMMSQFINEVDPKLLRILQPQTGLKSWATRQDKASSSGQSRPNLSGDQTVSPLSSTQSSQSNIAQRQRRATSQAVLHPSSSHKNRLSNEVIKVGSYVVHKTYGVGEVISIERKSRGEAARVKFDQTEKMILTSFLNLIESENEEIKDEQESP